MSDDTINLLHDGLEQRKNHACENIWVAIAVNEDGNEGMAAVITKSGFVMPLLTADMDNLQKVREMAHLIVKDDPRQKIIIRHFSNGVDVEEITG